MTIRNIILTTTFLALTACEAPAPAIKSSQAQPAPQAVVPAPTPANPNLLTSEGYGPLKIGMTQAQVDKAMGPASTQEAMMIDQCRYYHPQQAPQGMLVMVQDGILTRITLRAPSDLKTHEGFAVGDATETLKAAYGTRAKWDLHAYEEAPAGYLTVWTDKPRTGSDYVEDAAARGIVYEADMTGRIRQIHAGGPSIQLVEGCA